MENGNRIAKGFSRPEVVLVKNCGNSVLGSVKILLLFFNTLMVLFSKGALHSSKVTLKTCTDTKNAVLLNFLFIKKKCHSFH